MCGLSSFARLSGVYHKGFSKSPRKLRGMAYNSDSADFQFNLRSAMLNLFNLKSVPSAIGQCCDVVLCEITSHESPYRGMMQRSRPTKANCFFFLLLFIRLPVLTVRFWRCGLVRSGAGSGWELGVAGVGFGAAPGGSFLFPPHP